MTAHGVVITELERKAREFHLKNPHIWKLYCLQARELIKKGHPQYGSAAIWEWLRWEVKRLKTNDKNFKLPNNHRPYYARWWNKKHPEFVPRFFVERSLRHERGPVDEFGREFE